MVEALETAHLYLIQFSYLSTSKPFAMKKFILIVLILPFVSWAQEDSLNLKNQTIDEILKNRIPNGAIVENSISKISEIDSTANYLNGQMIDNQSDMPIVRGVIKLNEPIYVLNGVIISSEESQKLDIQNIESVQILKTTTSSVPYCRNLNPVIIIKTKDTSHLEEYDLSVLDVGYESFLKMHPSAGTFSLSYLQNRNQRYVSLWNQRTLTHPDIYEMPIDYDSQTFYGLEFEHKLYMFFKFMEKKHSISMM